MNHLPFTLTAYLFNALAVISNKFLLTKATLDPLVYIFYISLVSVLAIAALPFTQMPNLEVFTLASLSTLLWTGGAYFMFKALKSGDVSRVIPIIGTLVPLILLLFATQAHTVTNIQILSVTLLTAGLVFLTITSWQGKLGKWEFLFEFLSAAFFAVSYILLKQAYLKLDFFSVLIWSRVILLPVAIMILLYPALRAKIFSQKGPKMNLLSLEGLVFIGGQISGGLSELLITYSISLASPVLVNSLQGTQYIFLLFLSLLLSKKYPQVFIQNFTLGSILSKVTGIILVGSGLYLMAF